jgi:hypothetical protein
MNSLDPKQRRWHSWPAWAFLLVALYLLLSSVGMARSLISTEVWALYYAGKPLAEQLEALRLDLVHPPLMSLVQRSWLAVFGDVDLSAKILPVVINVPTLVLFTWLAWRITPRWRLASFLFSAPYLTIGSSPTLVRMYGLVLLWVVLAIIAWEAWTARPSNRRLIAWASVMVLLIYTHYFGLLMLAGFVTVNWLFGPRQRAFIVAAVAAGISFLPWFLYVFPVYQSRGLQTNLWWVQMLIANPVLGIGSVAYEYLGALHWSYGSRVALSAVACGVHLLLAACAWKSLRRLSRPARVTDGQTRWLWISALLAAVPILLLLLFSVSYMPALAPRFVLGILPAYWLLLVMLGELGGRLGHGVLLGIVLPWVLLSSGKSVIDHVSATPLRQHTTLAATEGDAADLILCDADVANAVYWEVARRHGNRGRIEFLRVKSPEEESQIVRHRSRKQDERLAVLPLRDLPQINLDRINRIWYFHVERELRGELRSSFLQSGFSPGVRKAGPPFLTILSRDGLDAGGLARRSALLKH